MKALIYDEKQLEQMLKDQNFYLSEGKEKDYLGPFDIYFIKKKFPEQSALDQVTDAVKDIADFTIEESPTGLIILTPIK